MAAIESLRRVVTELAKLLHHIASDNVYEQWSPRSLWAERPPHRQQSYVGRLLTACFGGILLDVKTDVALATCVSGSLGPA
jgi:hypothetical protein